MTNFLLKTIPPQAVSVYALLSEEGALSAKTIAQKLNILPPTVYRATKPLVEIGIIQEVGKYPIVFEAKQAEDAFGLYQSALRKDFQETFSLKGPSAKPLNISFIRDRQHLLEETGQDIKNAKEAVSFIVSGLEIPTEAILAYKEAAQREVKIRALVQNLDETSSKMFKNWQKIGVRVRHFPNMEARIFIIDKKIVYFTSYNAKIKEEAIGMRFEYSPYAKLMSDIFEKRWKLGKEI